MTEELIIAREVSVIRTPGRFPLVAILDVTTRNG
jgi:hypothetical protein